MKSRRIALGLLVVGALTAHSPGADAQPGRKVPRLGVLTWERCPAADSGLGTGLKDLGHTWGQSLQVDCLSAEGDYGRLAQAAEALARRKVDVIAALTHVTAYAAHRATASIPIVMIASGDPVKTGMVVGLARPGGNVTGLTYYAAELIEKRLELLKEMVPGMSRVAVLGNPDSDHVFGIYRQDADRGARTLGLQLVKSDARRPADLERSFEAVVRERAQGLVVLTDPMLAAQAGRIADLAARHRLSAIYWGSAFVEQGGLVAYSADFDAMTRRAAFFVDRILRGARPADLPVEQPTTFKLVINLKAANALGLAVPPALVARADRVIE
jgi:putative ABC transport system substrate-binding protein